MGILSRVRELNQQSTRRGLFGVQWGVPGADTWREAQQWVRATDTLRDPDSLQHPYSQVGPFQRVVSVRARDAASVPWEFFRVDANDVPTDDSVEGHPVSRLWQKPNGHMTGNQLLIGSYISYDVFGEWIWWYPDLRVGSTSGLRATQGARGEIYLLYPPAVIRKLENDGTISYKLRRAGQPDMPLDSNTVTHCRRFSPYSQTTGLPLAAAIISQLVSFYAAGKWNDRFFNEQNGVPTAVIVPGNPGQLSDVDDREELLRSFRHQGGASKRWLGILPGGFDIKTLGLSQTDMDFPELQNTSRDDILAAAGVPPLIAGYLTRPITYNASEQKELYWDSTIASFVSEQQAIINSDFLPKIGVAERVYPKWEVVQAILENLVEKSEIATSWFALGLSKKVINERLDMGWNPDDIPDYEVGYGSFSQIPIVALSDPRFLLPSSTTVGDDTEETEEPEEAKRYKKSVAGDDEVRRTLYVRRLVRQALDLEIRMNGVLRRHFHEIEEEVLSNVEGTKGWLATKQEGGAVSATGLLFDLPAAIEKLRTTTRPVHTEAIKRGGESAIVEAGVGVAFRLDDPVVQVRMEQLTRKIAGIDITVESRLRQSLSEGIGLGEAPQELAKRVRNTMDASLGRSMMIARTETGFAFSAGRDSGFRQAGVEKHEWVSARDKKVRQTHQIDGEVVDIGAPFSNGLTRPLDPDGPASEVIQCRCAAAPVLER